MDLGWLWRVLEARRTASPEASYTARLLAAGTQRIAQKVGEEAIEVALAAVAALAPLAPLAQVTEGEAGKPSHEALVGEASDLLYHLLVLLLDRGVAPAEVVAELRRRHAARGAQDLDAGGASPR